MGEKIIVSFEIETAGNEAAREIIAAILQDAFYMYSTFDPKSIAIIKKEDGRYSNKVVSMDSKSLE